MHYLLKMSTLERKDLEMINEKDIIDKILHYLGKTNQDVFVVQVGAMDGISFDDILGHITLYNWGGLYVEPVPYYFNKLVKNKKETDLFEQSAIVEEDGMIEMITIDRAPIESKEIHDGFGGMSAVWPPKNGFAHDYDKSIMEQYGKKIRVNGITLQTLFSKHGITQFDVFLCDVEGLDWTVFNQLDLSVYRPKMIRLEHINLTPEEKQKIFDKLTEHNYVYEVGGQDIDATPRETWDEYIKYMNGNNSTNQETITALITQYQSDKTLSGYSIYYDEIFKPIQLTTTDVLEIGIGTQLPDVPSSFIGISTNLGHMKYTPGGSLRAWRDYFTSANIVGIDVAEDCKVTEDRIETFIVSSLDKYNCDKQLVNRSFDIIIDDGLHTALAQLQTLTNFFGRVKPDGWYIIEDVGGGGDDSHILRDFLPQFEKIINGHEYCSRGNFIAIRKNGRGTGAVNTLQDLLREKTVVVTNNQLTVVTGLWDISRQGRNFDHYIENFKKFLEIPVNMFIYIPAQLEHLIWQKRTRDNTTVKILELSELKDGYYTEFWDKTQEIRTDAKWLNQTGESGWLQTSPQAVNEWYNPIVQSKMFMLHDAKVLNPFNTDYFIWLDAGITSTVYEKYFTENTCLDNIIPHLRSFLFLSYPYETTSEIHGFDYTAIKKYSRGDVKYVCRGGLFGGHKDFITQANSTYYSLLKNTLTDGYMGTEESIFSIMAHLEPHVYRRYVLDGNGLVVKYVQALLDNSAVLEPIPNTHISTSIAKGVYNPATDKTSLYVLGFNFPEQFQALIESFEPHPDWLTKPRKILINNSQDQSMIDRYDAICKKYNFEHIVTGENLGINRGRLLAAKHFHESDSDYYFFFEDDMMLHHPSKVGYCRNGFRRVAPTLYTTAHKIMAKEGFDFLKLSYTEVYMDNNIQVSWYNVPQHIRTDMWPNYDQLPVSGLDPHSPRTQFRHINVENGMSYISGDIYYANWPMIVSRQGNYKMFLETNWAHPYEQTWMSHMFQETRKGNLNPAVLLASPINHNRIHHYTAEERREN